MYREKLMLAAARVLWTDLTRLDVCRVWIGGEQGPVWGTCWRENLTSCRRNAALSRRRPWVRAPSLPPKSSRCNLTSTHTKGGFYHDGRFATLADVVTHYDSCFSLGAYSPGTERSCRVHDVIAEA